MAGRVVVVTGGAGGLGQGVTRVLVARGFRVVIPTPGDEWVAHARAAVGDVADVRDVDAGDPAAMGGLAEELGADGEPWALVHLVGGYHDGDPVATMDLDAWDRQFALNARSTVVAMRAVLPGMVARGGGRVVAVASRTALRPFAGAAAYAASKAAVIALVGAAAEEVKGDGITVNCVVPSVIDTPANRSASPEADPGRWVAPGELGEAIAFLVSEAGSGVTGAALPVYGRV
jgi:NAD(P)-dependent dehydrogenase (short-subunit alcohol dehydrogenase family)